MFDSKQTLTTRLTDAADLVIDFATLGEYGLEPVGSTPRGCEADTGTGAQICTADFRSRPQEAQESFSEVLFPNRHRAGGVRGGQIRCDTPSPSGFPFPESSRGPRRNAARKRGGRGASSAFTADGAAQQR